MPTLQSQIQQEVQKKELKTGQEWKDWLEDKFPNAVRGGFAPRHEQFWDWVWAIEPGVRPRPLVALWPRGGGKSSSAELAVAAIGLRGKRRYCIYVCDTQDRADEHLGTIASKLEEAGIERKFGKFGNSKGWRRNRLRAEGFTVDALGLNVASRGKKIDDDRPDLMIFDDIDGQDDTELTIEKKRKIITKSILPARGPGCAVLFAQNLIHPYSIATELSNMVPDYKADYLVDRIVSGPFPAIENLVVKLEYDKEIGANRHIIKEGEPTWQGQGIKECQEAIDTEGLASFLWESQHEVFDNPGALFRREWFEILEESEIPKSFIHIVRRWDEAATEGGGDWTAGVLIGKMGNTYYVLDVVRAQKGPTNRDKMQRETADADFAKYGKYVKQVGVKDPGSAGVDRKIAFQKLMAGYSQAIDTESGDKALRADGLSKESGKRNVKLLKGDWNEKFLRELERFTGEDGGVDDQVDAAAGAFNRLSKRRELQGGVA